MAFEKHEVRYLEALIAIANNLGMGSIGDGAGHRLRICAVETLIEAGYHYQENPDGWKNKDRKNFVPDSQSELDPARGYRSEQYKGYSIPE